MLAHFITDLVVKELPDGTWEVCEALRFRRALRTKWETYLVPKGFVTDFASVPRLPVVYLLAGNTAHAAAVVHDYLYQTHLTRSKPKADLVFLDAMKATGVPAWRRWLMYSAVSVCGFSSWSSGPSRCRILNR